MHSGVEQDELLSEQQQSEAEESINCTIDPKTRKLKRQIVDQGSCLCNLYVQSRLKRSGLLSRRVIQLLLPSDLPDQIVYDVFPMINAAGKELERLHPRIYSNISKQLSPIIISEFGEVQDFDPAPILLQITADELFKNSEDANLNWGSIVSMFAITGGLAVDCVRLGQYDDLEGLVVVAANIIDIYIAEWVMENGGWRGLMEHIHPVPTSVTMYGWLLIALVVLAVAYIIGIKISNLTELYNKISGT